MNPDLNKNNLEKTMPHIASLMYMVILILVAVIFFIYQIFNTSSELLSFLSFENESETGDIKIPDEMYTKN